MTREENRTFMKNFFERYYKKQIEDDPILVKGVGIPPEMLADGANPDDEWNIWKLIPSTATEKDFQVFEETHHVKLPECIKAFFSVYHYRFYTAIGRNDIGYPLYELERAYTHQLADNGYLPFGWDEDSFFIRCMDLSHLPEEEKCPIVEIDHEPFFDLQCDAEQAGILIPREQLVPLMRPVAENFYAYLNGVYENRIQ